MKSKIVVLASGEGTLLQALIDSEASYNYEISKLITDKPNAKAINRAQAAGIAVEIIEATSSLDWHNELFALLEAENPRLIVLAGFMRILPAEIVERFKNQILNSHPSLLPKYPGLNAVGQALMANEEKTGATMHLVDAGVDSGPVVQQVEVKVLPQDTIDQLHQRIKSAEQAALPKLVDQLVRSRYRVEAGKVVIDHE